jgi:preprotein translocase subunit SecD
MAGIRDNWRVIVLVLAILASTFALFSPTLAPNGGNSVGNATDSGPTNLQYGLQLSGGTRIRAPLIGVHASGVDFGQDNTSAVRSNIAAELQGVDRTDVRVRAAGQYRGVTQQTNIAEVTAENVSAQQLGDALSAAGYDYEETHDEVSQVTREQAIQVLRQKVNAAGLSGGEVRSTTTAGNEHFIIIEVPNRNRSSVLNLVESRGQVLIQAYHPDGSGGYTRTTLMTSEDLDDVGAAEQPQNTNAPPQVSVVVRESSAQQVQQRFVDTGVAQDGGTRCRYEESPNNTEPCILVVQDGQVINSFGMRDSLADSLRSGDWASNPTFVLTTTNFSEAQELSVNLQAGALPAKLDVGEGGEGSSMYVSSSQSEGFKRDSLIAGVIAVLAVSGVVFARYRRFAVAGPMVVTALSEVVILLGLAAAFSYPLDLSVIAGFIAAIGTGVDDLIIIADEVMAEGNVRSRKVFQSRFRKAFWVIGAAAATTIVALSPLAVLSLGDLKGFAIFTILGVIVGVLVTRPAYGDILRSLLTEDR